MVQVIKIFVNFNGKQEIRRLTVGSDVVNNYEALHQKIISLFQILQGKTYDLGWKDSDGDYIVMSSDEELAHAIANADEGLFKIYVNAHSDSEPQKGSEAIHSGVVCDGCNGVVKGCRYKCLSCFDFDLCSSCNANGKHLEHDMIKLVTPVTESRTWAYYGSRTLWKSIFGRHGCKMTKPLIFNLSKLNLAGEKQKSEKSGATSGARVKILKHYPEVFMHPKKCCYKEGATFAENCLRNFAGNPETTSEAYKKHIENFATYKKLMGDMLAGEKSNFSECLHDIQQEFSNGDDSTSIDSDDIKDTFLPLPLPQPLLAKLEENLKELMCDFTQSGARPKETPTQVAEKIVSKESSNGNQTVDEKSTESSDNEKVADGWTLVNPTEEKEKTPNNDKSEDLNDEKKSDAKKLPKEEVNPQVYADEKIAMAMHKMITMGFTNEGGWLERLLLTKNGNISEAIDALYPNTQRN